MWSLYSNNNQESKYLNPLKFSNNKTQEDVVNEVLDAIKQGEKIIFIKGVCGTGKSAIALNIAKELGKASIVVPIKNLQKQYEEDYSEKKYLLKNEKRLKIKLITGRANHSCPYLKENNPELDFIKKEENSNLDFFCREENFSSRQKSRDFSCDNEFLPCKIQIKEKNLREIFEYLKKNPKINVHNFNNLKINRIRRMSIAPVCPYWSPIAPAEMDLNLDAECKNYPGLKNRKFIFYRRKKGCGYYDQFENYIDADVLIFNSHKYKIESLMNRKPATDVEIIDECDEFLDSFSDYEKINIDKLYFALGNLFAGDSDTDNLINQLSEIARDLLKDPKIKQDAMKESIIPIRHTKIFNLLRYFLDYKLLDSVECDEENYCYHAEEIAKIFENFFDETYVCFCMEEKDLIVKLVTINLEKRLNELIDKNKVMIFMSGTLHSQKVLKNIFGLPEFKIIDAETEPPGKIIEKRTGLEINCRYSNFQNGEVSREQYLKALSKCIEIAKKPALVHVNAFNDLPTEREIEEYGLKIMSREKLLQLQKKDKVGEQANKFKKGEIEILYSTKCNRGVDFPGETCNSIIITRYPFPNISSLFWKILRKTKPGNYHEFYMDKAKREFLQRIYRGLRSKEDTIFILSPDLKVFSEVESLMQSLH